ncbi:hypothetical protein OK074_0736 [Actinobacteria bacterium OK074]|nr:hypothetical protein OK074_0736 [Actinobacteria bacterium OK074]
MGRGTWGATRRQLALGMAVLTVSGMFALVAPGSAEAAAYCAGHRVRELPFSTGSVQVFRNGSYVCAVTLAKKTGTRRIMSVSVQARGSRPVVDEGHYVEHAGPVTVHAGHRCVRVKGRVGRGSVDSDWMLC